MATTRLNGVAVRDGGGGVALRSAVAPGVTRGRRSVSVGACALCDATIAGGVSGTTGRAAARAVRFATGATTVAAGRFCRAAIDGFDGFDGGLRAAAPASGATRGGALAA